MTAFLALLAGSLFASPGFFPASPSFPQAPDPSKEAPLLGILAKEIDYSVANLKTSDGVKPYFLSYTVTDTTSVSIQAKLGALQATDSSRARALDVDLRVGDRKLDNTRQIRGGRGGAGGGRAFLGGATAVPLDDQPEAIRDVLWRSTDDAFRRATERYQQVLTNMKTAAKEENPSDDFSEEKASIYSEPDVALSIDRSAWTERVRAVSAMALVHPEIESSTVAVVGTAENRYLASSEGTRVKTGRKLLRVLLQANSKSPDGMEITQSFLFNAATEDRLPSEEEMRKAMKNVVDQVLALRLAPLVEPYTGPAILMNRASGVFFHEIFGHRIEGHRQKNEDEGQTFTKMVGQPVLPDFLSVVDDPTLGRYGNEDLRGFYRYDDEGVPAQRVTLVNKGVLETFLLSRSPLPGFPKSNGHGRREPGRDAVSRQGNLMVLTDKAVAFPKLREQLIELCKKQGKPFGLLFDDITGGFTTTTRGGPQAFKVQPVVVYRIYADGRPDELVRGVDIVGTPLSCFSRIVAAGDDTAVFNGTCGAESGWVPVTATSPSILVEQIEIEKKQSSAERAPMLASPIGAKPTRSDDSGEAANDTIFKALDDELARRPELKLSGTEAPNYVEYRVTDRSAHAVIAKHGALVRSEPSRTRTLRTDVRVGSYDMDNSNFGGGGGPAAFGGGGGGRRPGGGAPAGAGGAVALPEEDHYAAMRQAAWLATDAAYKTAVETYAQKKTALEGRNAESRPADFAKAEPVKSVEPKPALEFDAAAWEARMRRVSGRFTQYKDLLDSGAEFQTHADTDYLVTSEGTRERTGTRRASIVLHAEVQADDGDRISDRIVHTAETAATLPSEEKLVADVDQLVARLEKIRTAPRLKEYSGPVLFDGVASPQLFHALLGRGVAAQAGEVGGGRRRFGGGDALDKLVGKRILPASFHVFDDPRASSFKDTTFLAGHYRFDDEGVPAQSVELVKDGKLVGMVSSRTPTELAPTSNGHGRGGRATIGCMFVESSGGVSSDELSKKLLATAKDQGLPFALRVSSLNANNPGNIAAAMRRFAAGRGGRGGGQGGPGGGGRGPGGNVADPLVMTKVFVADGHEEPVRAGEFDGVSLASLKEILAIGGDATAWNVSQGGAPASVIAPPILLETVNLFGAEPDGEKKPAIAPPAAR